MNHNLVSGSSFGGFAPGDLRVAVGALKRLEVQVVHEWYVDNHELNLGDEVAVGGDEGEAGYACKGGPARSEELVEATGRVGDRIL